VILIKLHIILLYVKTLARGTRFLWYTSSVNIGTGVHRAHRDRLVDFPLPLTVYTADSVYCDDTKYKRILYYNNTL